MTQARRLPCRRTEGLPRMTSVLRELPLSYAVLSEDGSSCLSTAVREPRPPGPAYSSSSSTGRAPLSPSATPRRRSPTSSTPRVRLHLKPGQKGTKKLLAEYGERLICVRYRYDEQRKKRLKTVELLVAERDWEPRQPGFTRHEIVGLRVAFAEIELRDRVKQAGGTWNPDRRVWQLRYDRVLALGLKSRIVAEPASSPRCLRASGEHLHADTRPPSR